MDRMAVRFTMTLTTHAATGIIVANFTTSPLAGFIAAILSHYLTDAIPHGDEFIYWRHVHNSKDLLALTVASTDLLMLTFLSIAALNAQQTAEHNSVMMGLGIIGGILPDIFITLHTATRKKFRKRGQYKGFFRTIQHGYHLFLQGHYKLHVSFHNLMRIPIRFRNALIYQAIFLIFFIYFYL